MILFDVDPTPNPAKIALLVQEAGLAYETIPVDTSKGEQHQPSFRAINPNGKVPAIIDTDGPGGREARVFDSTAILIISPRRPASSSALLNDCPELLSGHLLFLASGLGPFRARRSISNSPHLKGLVTR